MSRRKKQRPEQQNDDSVADDDDCECEGGGDLNNFGCFMLVILICFIIGGCWTHNYFEKRAAEQHEIELKRLELQKGEAK